MHSCIEVVTMARNFINLSYINSQEPQLTWLWEASSYLLQRGGGSKGSQLQRWDIFD